MRGRWFKRKGARGSGGFWRKPSTASPTNLANNSWANVTGPVTTDGAGAVIFANAGNGSAMSEVPTIPFEASTVYNYSCSNTCPGFKVAFAVGTNAGFLATLDTGSPSGQFTTPSNLQDGKLYCRRYNLGSASGQVSNINITKA